MKILGITILLLTIPIFVLILRVKPSLRKWSYFGVGLLPFTIGAFNLDASFVSWGAWTGQATGFTISVLDTLALSIILTARRFTIDVSFSCLFALYISAVMISVFQSSLWMSSAFYLFQLARVFLVFLAVSTFAGSYTSIRWLAYGLAVGAIYQCVISVEQKISGSVQAFGTMGHQNLLGLMLHFATLPLLALILAGERSKVIVVGFLAALLAVSLGASRASLGFVGVGLIIVVLLSLVRTVNIPKLQVLGVGVLAAGLVVPVAYGTLADRFGESPITFGADGEREAFESAAREMWLDHPMGVGANQYVVTSNVEGYSERAGVTWNWSSRATKVHNMYLLAAAETGWWGLVSFSLLLSLPIVRGLGYLLKHRSDLRGDVVLGNVAAIVALALHGFYEWVFFMAHAQYLFAVSLAVIAVNIRRPSVVRRPVRNSSLQRQSLAKSSGNQLASKRDPAV